MPWTLTANVLSGDMDTVDYSEVKIVDQRHRSYGAAAADMIMVSLQYGNTVATVWTPAIATPRTLATAVEISDADYADITSTAKPDVVLADPSDATYWKVSGQNIWVEYTYVAVKRGLYEWLNTNGHIAAGAVT